MVLVSEMQDTSFSTASHSALEIFCLFFSSQHSIWSNLKHHFQYDIIFKIEATASQRPKADQVLSDLDFLFHHSSIAQGMPLPNHTKPGG